MTSGTPGNGADENSRGFTFPGRFEITAVGDAAADLKARVPQLLAGVGLEVLHETVRHRHSRAGNYISVTVGFDCPRAKSTRRRTPPCVPSRPSSTPCNCTLPVRIIMPAVTFPSERFRPCPAY